MKTIIKITLFLLVAVISIQSQTVFPLHVGDRWSFWDYPNYHDEAETVSDTSVFNGQRYYEIIQPGGYGQFFRQSGDSVFTYDGSPNGEYLIFDFTASVGDTITNFEYSPNDTLKIFLVSKGNVEIFGVPRPTWIFFIDHSQTIDEEISLTVTDSLGIVRYYSTWVNEHLSGAIINNVVYGDITDVDKIDVPISEFHLKQNYPNPFNPATIIEYSLPVRQASILSKYNVNNPMVKLKVFDILGQEVSVLVNKHQRAGNYGVKFDAGHLPSGVYFYQLQIGNTFVKTKKMTLLK